MTYKSLLHKWNLNHKRVFVRFDGNVPLDKNGSIRSTFRLLSLLPTLHLLEGQNTSITLATHLGRPTGVDPRLSTSALRPWFESQGLTLNSISSPKELTKKTKGVTLLENLRFDPREKNGDKEYAKLLRDHHDYYINDGWGVMHRSDTSITLLPSLFESTHKTFGLLVEYELKKLNQLIHEPEKPYIVLLGGGKVETKIPLLKALIARGEVTSIVLLPGIMFTFLKALGKPVGLSLVDEALVPTCKELVELAKQKGIELIFPDDILVGNGGWNGALSECSREQIPPTGFGISIGSQSLRQLEQLTSKAATIVYNGAMGRIDLPNTLKPFIALLEILSRSEGSTFIVGGDTTAIAEKEDLLIFYTFCSTGGGSTLAYLAGETLAGLKALNLP